MDPLQADVNTISAALKQNPNLLDAPMKQKLNDVRFNLSLLTRDGSRGSHNIDLTAEIFSIASKDLRALKSAIQPGAAGWTDANQIGAMRSGIKGCPERP